MFPHNTGGKIRTLNVLRHLAKWHDVTYVCNVLDSEQPFVEDMLSLGLAELKSIPWVEPPRKSAAFLAFAVKNLFSTNPLNVDKDFDSRLRETVELEVQTGQYDLLICDFVQMARNCIGLPIPKLLFQHNVEAEIFERLAQRNTFPVKQYLKSQAQRMKRFEGVAGADFDTVVAVSQRDKEIFERNYGWNHVSTIDTAVDTNFFQRPDGGHERKGVVFVGSLDWPPNVDGVKHFLAAIWPKIRREVSNAECVIVGRNPPDDIVSHNRRNGIEVTGTVEDIRPHLASASIAIVPLYSGGGTRLKIFEYMAMQCAVVSTTLGAEGLGVENGRHILLRDDDDDFSNAVIALLNDPQKTNSMAEESWELVQEKYSSEPVARQFEHACHLAVDRWKSRNKK